MRRAEASGTTITTHWNTSTCGWYATTECSSPQSWHISADEYTELVLDEAIVRFIADGLEATLAYNNSPVSMDAQWHVLIATPEGEILSHYNAEDFAAHHQEILDDGSFRATEDGVLVNQEDVNPTTGEVEDQHFWLVEHEVLVFGSGWHHNEAGS